MQPKTMPVSPANTFNIQAQTQAAKKLPPNVIKAVEKKMSVTVIPMPK
jgi:hypothetical protein